MNTLDTGIDVFCKFDHMLTVCTKKTANTKYHQLGEIQLYDGETTWIEKFDTNEQIQNATVRSYYYDKRAKYFRGFQTDLSYDVTRFEIKLQPKAFQASFDIKSIREQFYRLYLNIDSIEGFLTGLFSIDAKSIFMYYGVAI